MTLQQRLYRGVGKHLKNCPDPTTGHKIGDLLDFIYDLATTSYYRASWRFLFRPRDRNNVVTSGHIEFCPPIIRLIVWSRGLMPSAPIIRHSRMVRTQQNLGHDHMMVNHFDPWGGPLSHGQLHQAVSQRDSICVRICIKTK